MSVLKCVKCGFYSTKDSCPYCGNKTETDIFSLKNVCKKCGSIDSFDREKCDQCGSDILLFSDADVLQYMNYKVKIKGDPEIAQKLSAARKELALKYIENNPEFDRDAFEKTFEEDLIRCIGCDRRREEESTRNTKPIVECPYCHSKNTSRISSLSKAVSIAAFGLFSQKRKYQWHCNNCRSDF